MADERDGNTPEEQPAEGGSRGSKLTLALIVTIGLVIGATLGFSKGGEVLGPILAARAEAAEADGGGHGGGHGAEDAASAIHIVDNLVVNPARSGGTRFLLTSIAIEASSPDLSDYVRSRDVEVRAALILVLGAKSTEELSDIANRPVIVGEIRRTIGEILGEDVVKNVLIPQFVIQ